MEIDGAAQAAARSLRSQYGRVAPEECMRRLEAATAARNHRAAMIWADACILLRGS